MEKGIKKNYFHLFTNFLQQKKKNAVRILFFFKNKLKIKNKNKNNNKNKNKK